MSWFKRIWIKLFGNKQKKLNTVDIAIDIHNKLVARGIPRTKKCLRCNEKIYERNIYPWQYCPKCLRKVLGI